MGQHAASLRADADAVIRGAIADAGSFPTSIARQYADGETRARLEETGARIEAVPEENDPCHVFKACGGPAATGATRTIVDDLNGALIMRG